MTIHKRHYAPSRRFWEPAVIEATYHYEIPPVGSLFGLRGRAYRILEVRPVPLADYSPTDHNDVRRDPEAPPVYMTVEQVNPAVTKPLHWKVGREQRLNTRWHVLPEHHAVCADCGRLAPCEDYRQAQISGAALDRSVAAMAVLPGCCPSCAEPITTRQKAIYYPGPNLLNPLASDGVKFHQRIKCLDAAARYERQWTTVDPRNTPSLLTLNCGGRLRVHQDGSADCDHENCPSPLARHIGLSACYLYDDRCQRGCFAGVSHGTALSTPRPSSWPWLTDDALDLEGR